MRIAIGGSAANPPQWGHLWLLRVLLTCGLFDRVIWIISGLRPDKEGFVAPQHRKAMTELLLERLTPELRSRLIVVYRDLWTDNTPTIVWLEKLQTRFPQAILTWYTGSDSIIPQEQWGGRCEMEAVWHRGEELIANWNILVIPRADFVLPGWDHPIYDRFRNLIILGKNMPDASSTDIRGLIPIGKSIDHLTTPEIAAYIKQYGLYRGG